MIQPPKPLVVSFLNQAKALQDQGLIRFRGRDKNREALAELGISYTRRDTIIRDLTCVNFSHCSPSDSPAHVMAWVFGAMEARTELYIKLAIVPATQPYTLLCVSFHPANYKMTYAYQGAA